MAPTHNDPAPPSERRIQPYYLVDLIEVKKDKMQDFISYMYELLPVFQGPDVGWKLISATYTLTGRPCRVMHLWELPSADSLRDTMVKVAENETYLRLQTCVESEEQNLMSRMPYDPEFKERSMRVPGDKAGDILRHNNTAAVVKTLVGE